MFQLVARTFGIVPAKVRHRYAERSPIRQRALELQVEANGRFSESTLAKHQNAIGTALELLWDSTHATMGRHALNYGDLLLRDWG